MSNASIRNEWKFIILNLIILFAVDFPAYILNVNFGNTFAIIFHLLIFANVFDSIITIVKKEC